MTLPYTPPRWAAQLQATHLHGPGCCFKRASASFLTCRILWRQARVCGIPFGWLAIRHQCAAATAGCTTPLAEILHAHFLGAYSRRAGAAGPGRTTGTATSKAGTGLGQRVARTMSIASRFNRSALETHCTALHSSTRSLNETKWKGVPIVGRRNHTVVLQSRFYAKARAHQTRAVPPESSSQTAARTPSCRRRPRSTVRPSHPGTLRAKTIRDDQWECARLSCAPAEKGAPEKVL